MYQPIIKSRKYVTFDEKPVYAEDCVIQNDCLFKPQNLAIVMQGPLKIEEHFTYNTLKIYKKTFPISPIILSTWNMENSEEIKKIKQLGVIVLQYDAPAVKGFWNINYQILSTKNGLKYAKDLGAEYIIKTRTDQRFYESNIIEFLFNILKLFPVYDTSKQKCRLVTLSMNTFKYRLYDISDMFLFGHIDDVIKFWSCDFERREEFPTYNNMLEYCKNRPSEIYYTTEYLQKIGHDVKWTLADSWLAYARYFCVVDSGTVGLYWPKYSNLINRWRNFFGANPELEELTFKEWLNLYEGLKNKKDIPENLLVEGWKIESTLMFNENIFTNNRFKFANILKKIKKFLFYKKVNSQGYVIFKLLGVQLYKAKKY